MSSDQMQSEMQDDVPDGQRKRDREDADEVAQKGDIETETGLPPRIPREVPVRIG
jgi:hypothetical protein